MRGQRGLQPLCGVVSVWPAHQRPSDATRTESACQSSGSRSARHAAASTTTSCRAASATCATSGSSPRRNATATSASARRYAPINRLGNVGKPNASTRRNARRRPAYVGNLAHPPERLEISSRLSLVCHAAGREADEGLFGRYSVVPRERDDAVACSVIATGATVLLTAVPAIMSLLHLGGVF